MYYGLVMISVLMFGVQFYLSDQYRKENGTGADSVFTFSLIGALVGIPCFSVINGFDFSFTPFAIVWAFVTAVNSIAANLCTLKSLESSDLSVYSLFSMLGGMILPFCAGIFFYNESVTLAKVLCLVLVITALLITLDPKKKGGEIYYVGIFIFNGMSGVISKIYEDAQLPKISSAGYSLWTAVISAVLSAAAMAVFKRDKKLPGLKSVLLGVGGGLLNKVGNLILLISLAYLPASAQYPMVTGGVIAVSTVISIINKNKPSKKTLAALFISLAGILALVAVPI
ncbi:MAG: hypothetical protein E7623_01200 [Ruminococcaceae bacterium]|nr:hypothetical protein [Oscillospiraceae bacterium]